MKRSPFFRELNGVLFLLLAACGKQPSLPAPDVASQASTASVTFSYPTVDGGAPLRSEALRGRPAVIIFLTTFDLASQAQARFVSTLVARKGAKISAAAIVLEPNENRPLVLAFRDALRLRYPVAQSMDPTSGESGFGEVTVPTTVILDAQGRIVWRRAGISTDAELTEAIAHVPAE